jgi:hypothetical protein
MSLHQDIVPRSEIIDRSERAIARLVGALAGGWFLLMLAAQTVYN